MRVPPPIILRIFAVVLHPKEILKERNSTQMRVDWASLFIVETRKLSIFDKIKPGARLKGFDRGGIAEIVQVARFGADALNIVYRVNGRVGERLLYRGECSGRRRRAIR